jgi:hypothetical protein
MNKTKGLCMQCMPRTNLKAIFYKLFVLRKNGSFYDPVAAISFIIEKRMTYMLHVGSYLVGSASFQPAFHQCNIAELSITV